MDQKIIGDLLGFFIVLENSSYYIIRLNCCFISKIDESGLGLRFGRFEMALDVEFAIQTNFFLRSYF